ncbi:MAG: 50S ribosomal protein L18e [Candidatus Micrarchaeaceae archaeon]
MRRIIEKSSIRKWIASIESARSAKALKNENAWLQIEKLISMPKRKRIALNLKKLERVAKDGEAIVVPGKVLGVGTISKNIELCALEYSASSIGKLEKANCKILGIDEMLKKSNVRIIR